MESYIDMKRRHQAEFNAFPSFFAFNNNQFETGMRELGLEVYDTDKIYKGAAGMYYRRSDSVKLRDLLRTLAEELEVALKNKDFLREALQYELDNHEYPVTLDPEPALSALHLSFDRLTREQLEILNEIRKNY